MVKQLSAFSEHARGGRNKALVLGLVASLWVVSPGVQAIETGNPSKLTESKAIESKANEDFLQLPAFDLEWIKTESVGTLKVGDPLKLRVLNFNLQGTLIEASNSVDLQSEGWTLQIPEKTQNQKEAEIEVTAIPLKMGNLTLPSLAIKNAEGKAVARTNPFQIQVESAISSQDTKPQQPEDIEPPVGLQFPWRTILIWGIGILLVVGAAIYALYRWQRSKKPKVTVTLPEVKRSEDETALLHLEELERSELIKRREYKAFYFRLSEILKAYIGGRYRFEALESTTREIIVALEEKKRTSDHLLDRLEKVFDKLDRVKFTDHIPIEDEHRELLREAREFVMITRRPPSTVLNPTGESGHAVR